MKNDPIIILGFGRSGTTWVSDIISKSVGGLVLFEPFHPEVFDKAKECCYHNGTSPQRLNETAQQINDTLSKSNRNKWLIRNHLSSNLDDVSNDFAHQVWENCNVVGYKSIRQNFMAPWLYENVSTKIVFLKRDLLSVISSLLKRKQFWKEFGFDFHEAKFLNETLESGKYEYLASEELLEYYSQIKEDYLKMSFIWVVTHIIVEHEFDKLGLPIFDYNDFYEQPYKTTERVLNYLGYKDVNLHPSYFFTPSMLTLRTFHNKACGNEVDRGKFFTESLSNHQVEQILQLQHEILTLVESSEACYTKIK